MTGQALHRFVEGESCQPVSPPIHATVNAILERHGSGIAAILFYGSALRAPDDGTKTLDFYVLADSYRKFHGRRLSALANWLLPPNVYFLKTSLEGGPVYSKYAVLTLPAFERRTSQRTFEPLGWGRFAQPSAIVYARDDSIRTRLIDALSEAARTLLNETVGLMPPRFHARDIWVRALRESYSAELRAERPERALELYCHHAARYDSVANIVFSEARSERASAIPAETANFEHSGTPVFRWWTKLRWAGRRVVGKLLSVLRLSKAIFTFDGGLDYILGKIESHSGVSVTPTPWQRRHPLLAAPLLAWRLHRRNGFR